MWKQNFYGIVKASKKYVPNSMGVQRKDLQVWWSHGRPPRPTALSACQEVSAEVSLHIQNGAI